MAEILLGEYEKLFIISGIQENIRTDGRSALEYRPIEIETDVISNCSGSAHLRLANTDVLVGVKAELEAPDPNYPNQGRIGFFVDCTANANPEFEGRGGEITAVEISCALSRAFRNPACLDLASLCVLPGEQVWVLHIDVLILECGGTLLDACSMAVKASLYNTKIPSVSVTTSGDGTSEIEVSDDPFDVKRLDVSHVPCFVTLSKIGARFIVDATQEEEACRLATLVVAVTGDGTICYTRKGESGSLHPQNITDVLETCQKLGMEINEKLMEKLKEEVKEKKKPKGFLF